MSAKDTEPVGELRLSPTSTTDPGGFALPEATARAAPPPSEQPAPAEIDAILSGVKRLRSTTAPPPAVAPAADSSAPVAYSVGPRALPARTRTPVPEPAVDVPWLSDELSSRSARTITAASTSNRGAATTLAWGGALLVVGSLGTVLAWRSASGAGSGQQASTQPSAPLAPSAEPVQVEVPSAASSGVDASVAHKEMNEAPPPRPVASVSSAAQPRRAAAPPRSSEPDTIDLFQPKRR